MFDFEKVLACGLLRCIQLSDLTLIRFWHVKMIRYSAVCLFAKQILMQVIWQAFPFN